MRVDLHPEAQAEFRAATLWYEERRDRLGDEFIAAIGAALQRISQVRNHSHGGRAFGKRLP